MPNTPEDIGREAGKAIADAIADGIAGTLFKLVDKIAEVQAEQAEIRDGMLALSNRIEALTRTATVHAPAHERRSAHGMRWNATAGVWERIPKS